MLIQASDSSHLCEVLVLLVREQTAADVSVLPHAHFPTEEQLLLRCVRVVLQHIYVHALGGMPRIIEVKNPGVAHNRRMPSRCRLRPRRAGPRVDDHRWEGLGRLRLEQDLWHMQMTK